MFFSLYILCISSESRLRFGLEKQISVLESTKYGMVQKSGDYSVAPSKAQIDALSDSYKGMADEMLKECVSYALLCKKNGDSLFENVLNGKRNTNITDYIIINKKQNSTMLMKVR